MNRKAMIVIGVSLAAASWLVARETTKVSSSGSQGQQAPATVTNEPSNRSTSSAGETKSSIPELAKSHERLPSATQDSRQTSSDASNQTNPIARTQLEPPQVVDVANSSLEDIRSALAKWRACYDIECTSLPLTDPKSHDFAVGEKLRGILDDLAARARNEELVDSVISEIARDYLANDDGHVQSAALNLLATQPKDPKSLDALLMHVVDGYDAVLVGKALPEIRRYLGGNEDARIHETLRRAMTIGAPFVSEIVSSKIEPFITQESVDGYASLLSTLDPGSVVTKSLRSALNDFVKRRSGG